MQQAVLANVTEARVEDDVAVWALQAALRPVQLLLFAPTVLFFAALTAMLLRHPDVRFYEIDRVAFGLLVAGVLTRALILRKPLFRLERASWPMIALTGIALASVMAQPFDQESWSLLASKFIVPFTLFHLAAQVFDSERPYRQFEIFALVVLAYLSFTAIAFLAGANSLIFPRYILDSSLGFHATRARGPLLQAVANGVSLNILALVALHSYQRGSLRKMRVLIVLASVPVAILATMTRAVWLSFGASAIAIVFLSENQRLRRRCVVLGILAAVGLAALLSCSEIGGRAGDRLEEQGPIAYRQAVYAGGWEMFLQRPLWGWGFHRMPAELPHHVSGYKEKVLYPHNTYLELLVEHGVAGLGLYLWLMWEIFKLGRCGIPDGEQRGFLNLRFHRMWPILLAVYWVNASMVSMSYQFVNGLVFTLAGMLAAQRRRAQSGQSC